MRAIIHEKVATGESDRDIQQYFVGRYGARVLLAPPKDSRNFIFWALPFAVLALGTGLAILFLRSSMRRRQAFDPALSQGRGQSGADRFMPSYAQRDRWGSQVEHDVEELE